MSQETLTSLDGTPLAYWRSGEGPPLVLVHGTTADQSRWTPVLPAFERRFTVYAIDRRGRGGSGDPDDYAIEREFEDVAAVVDSLGEPVFLLGHSYGALCALEAALLTRNVRKLVLYEPPMDVTDEGINPPGMVGRLEALLEAGDRDEVVATMLREVAGVPPEGVEYMRSLPAWQARVAAAHTIPRELTAAPVSIDPCVVAFGHETVFEGSEIEGACRRRLRQTQAGGRQDLLGVDANHKALAQEEEGQRGRGARTDPRQARKERGDAQGVVAEAPGGQRRPYPGRTSRGF